MQNLFVVINTVKYKLSFKEEIFNFNDKKIRNATKAITNNIVKKS